MVITKEQAKADLERMLAHYKTLGDGTEIDRAAQLVIQPIEVLERILEDKGFVKWFYFDLHDTSKMLGPSVYEVAKNYIDGQIDCNVARERLQDIQKQYTDVFNEMGISPTVSKNLFGGIR